MILGQKHSRLPLSGVLNLTSTFSSNPQIKMATQRALLVQEIGKPLVLVHDRLVPEPGQDQILIKVAVAGGSDTC